MSMPLTLPVSFGEAADKLTILQIKKERIRDPAKLANVETELAQVSERFFAATGNSPGLDALLAALKRVNERLWDLEEAVREHERRGDFGADFVRIAREIYFTNDERARAKRELDVLLNSPIMEEKSYIQHSVRGGG